jgi:hypothetical protein
MTDEGPKSAFELAMERLRKKDADAGVEDKPLSEAQKAEIAEVKRVYTARLAQAEILHKSQLATVWNPEERAKIEDGHRREVQRLQDERESKLARIRG